MPTASEAGQEDRNYWSDKYDEPDYELDEPSCKFHGTEDMYFSAEDGEWFCAECEYDDEWLEIETYG